MRSDGHFAKTRAKHIPNPIVLGQPLVDQGIVRMDKVENATVAFQQIIKKGNGFCEHRIFQGIVCDMRDALHAVQTKPLLDKVPNKPIGTGIGQHPFDFGFKDRRFLEFFLFSQFLQSGIRNTRP